MRLHSIAGALALGCIALGAAQAAPVYRAIDLGTLAGASESHGNGIAAGGLASGSSYLGKSAEFHAFRRTAGGGLEDLGSLGAGLGSYGTGINAAGSVVGASQVAIDTAASHAVMWSGATLTDLTPGSIYSSVATGINASNQASGWYMHYFDGFGGTITSAFRYSGGTLQELAPLAGNFAAAWGLNDAGQVVGDSTIQVGGSIVHGFFFDGTTMVDIGTLVKDEDSHAYAINNLGQVTGSSVVKPGQEHVVRYEGGVLSDLGVLDGTYTSTGKGINNAGTIVGTAFSAAGRHGFVTVGGVLTDLESLIADGFDGWDIWDITGINDAGQIVGSAITDGALHAFLFDPFERSSSTPEPTSATLALFALALLGARRRRPASLS